TDERAKHPHMIYQSSFLVIGPRCLSISLDTLDGPGALPLLRKRLNHNSYDDYNLLLRINNNAQ
ncbi:9116_t:CDS:1, partial [Funneliformis geosporum]